jgi:hypothetical protein
MLASTFWGQLADACGMDIKELTNSSDEKKLEVMEKEYEQVMNKASRLSSNAREVLTKIVNNYKAALVKQSMEAHNENR